MDKNLIKRLIDISYKHKLSHIGSCLGALPILDDIYSDKREQDKVILSAGHAGLALYCVLEKYHGLNAEELFLEHGVHPSRNLDQHIYCSTGSLGQGITVAVGLALGNKDENVYVYSTDGELREGSCWESLFFCSRKSINNIRFRINWNGFTAYDVVNKNEFQTIDYFLANLNIYAEIYKEKDFIFPFLNGLGAHYYVMNEDDYKIALDIIEKI